MITQVTINVSRNGEPRSVWFLFETGHASLAALNDELAERGSVHGVRIDSHFVKPGHRREQARYECIVSRETIVTITQPQFKLLPPEAEPVQA